MKGTRYQRRGVATARAGPLLLCCLLPFIFCALASPARSAPPSVIGVHVRDLPTVNREDSDWNAYMDALEERRPFRGLICQRRVDDASIRSFQLSGRPVFDNKSEFLGFRCVTSNVTARRRFARATSMSHLLRTFGISSAGP